jgi:hypothetical protein
MPAQRMHRKAAAGGEGRRRGSSIVGPRQHWRYFALDQVVTASRQLHSLKAAFMETDEFASWVAGMKNPDSDVRIRHSGKWMNWETLPAAAIPVLVAALDDENLWVRGEAAGTLCVHGQCEELAWNAFRRILMSDDEDAIVGALSILSDSVSAAAVATELLTLLKHENAEVRQFAVQAFRMGIQESAPSQRPLGTHSEQELESRFPGIMKALPHFQRLLMDPAKRVRIEAANCLFCFGPLAKGSLPVFHEWSKSSDEEQRRAGAQGVRYVTGE